MTSTPIANGTIKVEEEARLVYYSFLNSPTNPHGARLATEQLLRSVASLRAHNGHIAVRILTYGEFDANARAELRGLGVTFVDAGDYERRLLSFSSPLVARTLSKSPHLHAMLCLALLDAPRATRVLYLDSDTLFFRDVGELFDRYTELDVYAREEPWSRASDFGYDPSAIDEDLLEAMTVRLGGEYIPPFNKGIVLFNHGAWQLIASKTAAYLQHAFRLAVGIALRSSSPDFGEVEWLRAHLDVMTSEVKESGLAYPSSNTWIREQVAVWLTFALVPGLRVGKLSRHDTIQGGEFERIHVVTHVVAHYFGKNTESFGHWWDENRARAARWPVMEPARKPLIERMGDRIDAAWRAADRDPAAFTRLAKAVVGEAGGARQRLADDARGALIRFPDDVEQVALYQGARFSIAALSASPQRRTIRRTASPRVAFVLNGAMVRCRYTFKTDRKVSARMLLGSLTLASSRTFVEGEVVDLQGDEIESLHPVGPHAIVIVCQPKHEDEDGPRYEYRYPSLAFAASTSCDAPAGEVRRLRELWLESRPEAQELTSQFVQEADLEECWSLARELAHVVSLERLRFLMELAASVHSVNMRALERAIDEDLRVRRVWELRARRPHGEAADLLSLLGDFPVREPILALLDGREAGGGRHDRVLRSVVSLSQLGELEVDVVDPLNQRVLGELLQGREAGAIVEGLGDTFDEYDLTREREILVQHCEELKETFLAPLFR